MKLIILGDVLPQEINMALFERNDIDKLIGSEMRTLFESADQRICNIEGVLTDTNKTIIKNADCIKGSKASVIGIKGMGIDCVSLANNHIMDYEVDGFNNTIEALNKVSIKYFGAGFNREQAKQPYICNCGDRVLGLYSCAEYEFTIAEGDIPGANRFDDLNIADDIRALRREVDYLVVLYHGGKEYYRFPAPYLQERCRKLVDCGADLVLCQHSHCIGSHEKWNNGEILYGQGNFLFHRKLNEFTENGLIVQVTEKSGKYNLDYIPVVRKDEGVRLAEGKNKNDILREFESRSERLKDQKFIYENYMRFAEESLDDYLYLLLGKFGILARIIRKVSKIKPYDMLFKENYTELLNISRCEAHRDLFIHGLKGRIYK